MITGEDIQGMRKMQDMTRWISLALLFLHFYFYCYQAFHHWGLTALLSDRILANIVKTGLFNNPETSRSLALGFLLCSQLGANGRKNEKLRYRTVAVTLFLGALLYFGSRFVFRLDASFETIAVLYMSITFIGYLLVLSGSIQLSKMVAYSYRKRYFTTNEGFQQQEKPIKNEFSINLQARYRWEGKIRKSWINFINPRRGLLILGSPGCGKSWFIIEQAIHQLMRKGFSLFVYDFKYDALTSYVYNKFLQHRSGYPANARFYNINFSDLSRSHRCNLIDPQSLQYLSDAIGVSRTILLSMNKTWINRQGEFFVESPINFLAAVIWWLRKYQGGAYCTLPHAIELAQEPYDKLFTILNAEPEIRSLIGAFIQAYKGKSFELLDSQIASAKVPLGRLTSPDLYYILTGNDLSLDINDPHAPKILCLGGDPTRQEGLAPVLSLYIDRLNKLINKPGKHKSAVICDEFATVRATSILTTIATARSNNIITIIALQDLSQLRIQYSRDEADLILNICSNLACGQVGGETARWVSERFHGAVHYKTTISMNSSDTSISKTEQVTQVITPATIATLSSGEFLGIVADDPDMEISLKAFHATITRDPDDRKNRKGQGQFVPLPITRKVDKDAIEANYLNIKQDVRNLVDQELERILGDPTLAQFIIR